MEIKTAGSAGFVVVRAVVAVILIWILQPLPLQAETAERVDAAIQIDAHKNFRRTSPAWLRTGGGASPIPFIINGNDLGVYETGVDVQATVNQIYSKARINFGKVLNEADERNRLQGAGYETPPRHGGQTAGDDIRDLCIGLGYQMDFLNERLKIIPLAGLSYHAQTIHPQDIAGQLPTDSQTGGANGYESEWRSWYLGFDMNCELADQLYLKSSFEYHNADYEAASSVEAAGSLTGAPMRSIHTGNGEGAVVNVSINRVFAKRWLIGLMYGYQDWTTEAGTEDFAGFEGRGPDGGKSGRWGNQSINLSIGYNF